MKKMVIFLLTSFFVELAFAQCPITPRPQEYEGFEMKVELGNKLLIDSTGMHSATWNYFKSNLKLQTGIELVHDSENPLIAFQRHPRLQNQVKPSPISNRYEIRISTTEE